jgi:hypothetical protein
MAQRELASIPDDYYYTNDEGDLPAEIRAGYYTGIEARRSAVEQTARAVEQLQDNMREKAGLEVSNQRSPSVSTRARISELDVALGDVNVPENSPELLNELDR